jgi:hypothetical protein
MLLNLASIIIIIIGSLNLLLTRLESSEGLVVHVKAATTLLDIGVSNPLLLRGNFCFPPHRTYRFNLTRLTTLTATVAPPSTSLATVAFALVAVGRIRATAGSVVAAVLSSTASLGGARGVSALCLLLQVGDFVFGVCGGKVEVRERGFVGFEASFVGLVLFVSAHGEDGGKQEAHVSWVVLLVEREV